ncbi:MAG: acyl-CoA dehydrogenase family protein [Rhizomicrobium sp.]
MTKLARGPSIPFPETPGLPVRPAYVELPETGFEEPLTGLKKETLELVHRFARDVMRPQGALLDRLAPEQMIAKGSPYWSVIEKHKELGLSALANADLSPSDAVDLQAMISEELGWGDSGLAISIGGGGLPRNMAARWGRTDLLEAFPESLLGSWGITEPVAGSDMLDWERHAAHPQGTYERPSMIATLKGDKIVLNGQKSAWVSNGVTADFCSLFTTFDRGQGREGINIYVSLNQPGVSRGKPLDKMGQRAVPQGEIFFDDVEVPVRFIAAAPDRYSDAVYDILCEANAGMGTLFVGVARAAYEHALAYAHERKQGGVPIIHHQNVRYRLFHMLRKTEAARALARRVVRFNALSGKRALHASIASKVTCTQTAFEVASDALQIFGGNGMTKAYPLEKLLRDARASLIEDGCNELLSIKGGSLLVDPDKV